MTVRIGEVTELPPPSDAGTPPAAPRAGAKPVGQVQIMAAIRRETARRDRLWAD